MNQVIRVIFLTLLFSLALVPMTWAEMLLEDDFDDTGKVDLSRTTAYVDTANSLVRLPKQTMPNSIVMLKYGEGYAVVTTDGIIIAEYDDATGSLYDTTIPWLTDARGLAIRQDDMGLWVIGDDYVQFCSFAGGAYSDDPALKASGISEILSVGAVEGTNQGVVLSKSASGKARITRYRAGASLTVELDMELDIDEPTALAVVDGTPDLVVLSKTGQHYLMFDDATGGYTKDPARSASGMTFASSVSANSDGTAILDNGEGKYLIYDDAGGMQQVLCYSTGPVPGAVALSLKPGAYDQAFVTEDGEVQYYIFDDSTGDMTRLPELERTGMQLAGGYQHPRDYYSKEITAEEANTVRLTADQEIPGGTTVKWYLSTDGGLTWAEVKLGQWVAIGLANSFILRATLDTADTAVTPKIFKVTLEASKLGIANLRLTAITYPPGAAADPILEPTITVFPINIHAGSKVQFQVDTTGLVEQVVALFSDGQLVILEPECNSSAESNTWSGEYSLSPELTDGMSVAVTFTATDIWGRKAYLVQNPFLIIEGNIASFSKVILTE